MNLFFQCRFSIFLFRILVGAYLLALILPGTLACGAASRRGRFPESRAPVSHIRIPATVRVGVLETEGPFRIRCEAPCRLRAGPEVHHFPAGTTLRILPILPEGARATQRVWVQAGAFSSEATAVAQVHRIREFDPELPVTRVVIHGRQVVQVGPYPDRDAAERVRRRLRAIAPDAWIRTEATTITAFPVQIQGPDAVMNVDLRDGVTFDTDDDGVFIAEGKRLPARVILQPLDGGRVAVVNELPLELYLVGVLVKELSPERYPVLAALKAQAVAARTYTLRHLGRYASRGFDICATQQCQVYEGVPAREGPAALAYQAVEETRGEIVVYRGQPALTLYTSTCGGHTEDAHHIFPSIDEPYLKGVACTTEPPAERPPDIIEVPFGNEPRSRRVGWWLATHGLVNASPDRIRAVIRSEWSQMSGRSPDALPETRRAFLRWLGAVFRGARWETLLAPDEPARLSGLLESTRIWEDPDGLRGVLWMWLTDRDRLLQWKTGGWHRKVQFDEILEIWASIRERVESTAPAAYLYLGMQNGRVRLRPLNDDADDRVLPLAGYVYQVWGETWSRGRVVVVPGQVVRALVVDDVIRYLEVPTPPRWTGSADRGSVYAWWMTDIDADELNRRLQEVCRDWADRVRSFEIVEKSKWGRVLRMRFIGAGGSTCELRGYTIRRVLGTRELRFRLWPAYGRDETLKRVVMIGRGWGHGVGLCQVGAVGMALEGKHYRAILQHYYPGTRIIRVPSADTQ